MQILENKALLLRVKEPKNRKRTVPNVITHGVKPSVKARQQRGTVQMFTMSKPCQKVVQIKMD